MKLTSSLRKISVQLIHPWVAASAMVGLLSAAPTSFAAAPPANTLIGNQASATYVDPNGTPQSSTSNLVQTTIQQVGAFNLDTKTALGSDVVNTKTGAAGTTVYASHVLTNTGNGTDSFDIKVDVPGPNPASGAGNFFRVAVFKDANFDGRPDDTTELCSVTTATGTCTVPAQVVTGNGGQFGFVVAYTLAATASTPTTPYNSGLVTAKPIAASLGLYAAGNVAASDVDNINLTTAAAFNLTKTIAQPGSGIAAPGGGAWPVAANNGPRSSGASCATTWSAGLTSSASCQYTVFTMTYTNTGGAPGRFVLKDVIGTGATKGLTYVTGSAVWSNKGGTGLGETAGNSGVTGVDYAVTSGTGTTLTFVDNDLPVNVTRTLSFVVLVNGTAALGTAETTNTALFNPTDVPGATASNPGGTNNTPPSTPTNGAPYTTTGTYSLTLSSTAGTATATNGKDTTAGTPNSDPNDNTTVDSAPSGGAVPFTVKVWNTGNAVDAVNIEAVSAGTAGGTSFPAGTVFQYFKADGATPLTDTNGDGKVDTGPIPAGETLVVVVKAILPANAAPATGPFVLTVTGTSVNDATQKDATKDQLSAITGIPVDITNTASGTSTGNGTDVGPGPSSAPTNTYPVQAGSTVAIPLYVKNNDTVDNTFALATATSNAFPGTLPPGWTVKFVAGIQTVAQCASGAAITTVSVTKATQGQVTACVTVPSSQAPVTAQPLYFQVKSTANASTGGLVYDVKFDAVTVTNTVKSATVGPATSTGQTTPGGSVVYPQTLTNTGSVSCTGPYTVTANLPAADVAAGWQAAVYLDANNNGQLDAGDTLVPAAGMPGPLDVGASQKFLVKVFSAAGAAVGATDEATITVNFPADSCGAPSSKATTSVVTGQIRVLKTQAIDAACTAALGTQVQTNLTGKPGQCIVYQVTATNQGTANVANLAIKDAVPAFTTLHATQPAAKCVSSGSVTPAQTNSDYSVTNNAVQCGSATNTVAPGGSLTLTFQVKINE